ncbi:MAG: histidinol dehydrogenase [Candidatus Methanomethylicia archaeon]
MDLIKIGLLKDMYVSLLSRRRESYISKNDLEYVENIIKYVREKGDDAIIDLTNRFDGVKISKKDIIVSKDEIEEAYSLVCEDDINAIKTLRDNVMKVEESIIKSLNLSLSINGFTVKHITKPLSNVGVYAPGGLAYYPSSLIMSTIPAFVAGVSRICICTPPSLGIKINPVVLVAADICGVKEIYRVGGAQAIAALAYGTETVKSVDKIVGPGGKYVSIAKLLVSRDVLIDMFAGPSELLVLADESANPKAVALDLISQAEHSPDSIVGLVTTSRQLALNVYSNIVKLMDSLPRHDIVEKSLSNNGFIALCTDLNEAIAFINNFAPEHLEIIVNEWEYIVERILNAGLILIGNYTPTAVSDYYIGVNHVLPTGGYARVYSGLSSLDFIKRICIVSGSIEGLKASLNTIRILAINENLPNHFLSVKYRLTEM